MNPVGPAITGAGAGDFSSFWGVRHSPFLSRVPVPSSSLLENQRALAGRLIVAAQEGSPLVVVKGEDGAGTTTLARWLYEALPSATHMALLLAPGAPGVEPAALSQRIMDMLNNAPGNPSPAIPVAASLRDQMLGLAPVFDWLRGRGKKLAVVLDNSGFLSGESWAAFFLSVLRQGELVDNVVQFFLFGGLAEMDAMSAGWPRALSSRTTTLRLQTPADSCLHAWLRMRLVMAGMSETRAKAVFSEAAASQAVHAARGSLTRLGRIASGAMSEAFLGSRKMVEARDVMAVVNGGVDFGQQPVADARGHRQSGRPGGASLAGGPLPFASGSDTEAGASMPRLIDLVKLD